MVKRVPSRVVRSPLTQKVIGIAIAVHRHLGPGLLESAYRRLLAAELTRASIAFAAEAPVSIDCGDIHIAPAFRADFFIEQALVVEIKAVERLLPVHSAQTITYMRLLGAQQALLINFNVPILRHGLRSFLSSTPPVPPPPP